MNGQEYTQLFELVQEARDAALAALAATEDHSKRLDVLETTVSANSTALAVGKVGVRALAVLGSLLIGLGGFAFGLWEHIGGNGGPN